MDGEHLPGYNKTSDRPKDRYFETQQRLCFVSLSKILYHQLSTVQSRKIRLDMIEKLLTWTWRIKINKPSSTRGKQRSSQNSTVSYFSSNKHSKVMWHWQNAYFLCWISMIRNQHFFIIFRKIILQTDIQPYTPWYLKCWVIPLKLWTETLSSFKGGNSNR